MIKNARVKSLRDIDLSLFCCKQRVENLTQYAGSEELLIDLGKISTIKVECFFCGSRRDVRVVKIISASAKLIRVTDKKIATSFELDLLDIDEGF